MGNFLVRSQLNVDPVRVEAIWLPLYQPNEMPIDENMIGAMLTSQLPSLPIKLNVNAIMVIPTSMLSIILQEPIPVAIKIKAPINIAKVDVSPIDPGINPMNESHKE